MAGPRGKTAFYCTQCGAQHSKWQGQCRECGQWNTLVEERLPQHSGRTPSAAAAAVHKLAEIGTRPGDGLTTGIGELDRVLGGSVLPGQTVLLVGEPGIGKSTLLLQAAEALSRQGLPVLYVTGEESLAQIKVRAARLGTNGEHLMLVHTTALEEIVGAVETVTPRVVLVDSIQTVAGTSFDSPPGTVAQVRESAHRLIEIAKERGLGLVLVGHVTKEGIMAGPKVLEHMVDTVVYFEGDTSHLYRMLRATKNRFGSISEMGLFEMSAAGLVEVADPSSIFLSDHTGEIRTGAVVTGVCEGNRPILVELQALVTAANYGNPQRVATGLDNKRLALLLAIMEKRCGFPMGANDVFVSVAGGLRLTEPGVDLPLMVALASSLQNRAADPKTLVVGEVGLSGEVRGVSLIDRRLTEAARMGFTRAVVPRSNIEKLTERPLELVGVSDVQAALDEAMG